MKTISILLLLGMITFSSCGGKAKKETFTTVQGQEMSVSSLIGKNVFDVAYEYSKVSPETLKGTNNKKWVVYYSDIDVTCETEKKTDLILNAWKGKVAQ